MGGIVGVVNTSDDIGLDSSKFVQFITMVLTLYLTRHFVDSFAYIQGTTHSTIHTYVWQPVR